MARFQGLIPYPPKPKIVGAMTFNTNPRETLPELSYDELAGMVGGGELIDTATYPDVTVYTERFDRGSWWQYVSWSNEEGIERVWAVRKGDEQNWEN